MILKPSEVAPLSAYIFTKIIDEAGLPDGVFNMINGDGPGVGTALSNIQESTWSRSGVNEQAPWSLRTTPTVKRISQELGSKSPNII